MRIALSVLMVKTTIELSDEIDQKFRQSVAIKKGMRKGALGEALEEAVNVWLDPEAQRLVEKYRTKATKGKKKG